MNLTCKWVTDEGGALVMQWTSRDDGVPVITRKPGTRKVAEFSAALARPALMSPRGNSLRAHAAGGSGRCADSAASARSG